MDKRTVLDKLGGVTATARFLQIDHGSVSRWPDPLSKELQDKVMGAYIRQGRRIPKDLLRQVRGLK